MHRTDITIPVPRRQRNQIRVPLAGKNGLEDLRKALWYLNRAKEESPYEPLGLYPLDSFVPPYCYFHVNDRNDEHCGLSLSGSASERL